MQLLRKKINPQQLDLGLAILEIQRGQLSTLIIRNLIHSFLWHINSLQNT